MSVILRIKRRLAGNPGPPDALQTGELAFNEVDNTLYIGVESLSTTSGELSGTVVPVL